VVTPLQKMSGQSTEQLVVKPSDKPKSARRRSREFAMQGVYQWLIGKADVGLIQSHVMESPTFEKADREHFETLLGSAIRNADALRIQIGAFIDRPIHELSPVEHATLLVAAQELQQHLEIPYRVVINEAVEIAKSFGGTDGFKYVNGVLDKLAAQVRPVEVQANVQQRPQRKPQA
jgi:transcription antitermination protein NusB